MNGNLVSWLGAAATRADLVPKARASAASVAVFDFEDGLPPEDKAAGRYAYRAACRARTENRPAFAVRINPLTSRLGLEDILFLLDYEIVPETVVLPHFDASRDVAILASLLVGFASATRIYAVIESLQGIRALREEHGMLPLLGGFILGTADLAADIGARLSRLDLTFYRSEVAFAAKRLGVAAIDSPCFQLDDETTLRAECASALSLGFDGKMAIHPNQVPIINEYFDTASDDVAHARELMSRHVDRVIVKVNGVMTGPPFLRYARKVLERAATQPRGCEGKQPDARAD